MKSLWWMQPTRLLEENAGEPTEGNDGDKGEETPPDPTAELKAQLAEMREQMREQADQLNQYRAAADYQRQQGGRKEAPPADDEADPFDETTMKGLEKVIKQRFGLDPSKFATADQVRAELAAQTTLQAIAAQNSDLADPSSEFHKAFVSALGDDDLQALPQAKRYTVAATIAENKLRRENKYKPPMSEEERFRAIVAQSGGGTAYGANGEGSDELSAQQKMLARNLFPDLSQADAEKKYRQGAEKGLNLSAKSRQRGAA